MKLYTQNGFKWKTKQKVKSLLPETSGEQVDIDVCIITGLNLLGSCFLFPLQKDNALQECLVA